MTDNPVLVPFLGDGHDHDACTRAALDVAETLCRRRGARLTPMRRRVLELVWQNHAPVKAYDLLDSLRAERGRVAPPTVYRALEFLLDEGLVHRIASLNAFIGCGDPAHFHSGQFMICSECGRVAELDDPEVVAVLDRRAARLGFTIARQTVEIEGVCQQCQQT